MGNYYRCCIPSLGDENAHLAFYALPIVLASASAKSRGYFALSPRFLAEGRATAAVGTGPKSSRQNRKFCNEEMVAEEGFEPPTQGL
jgi:hypothetical protein